MSYIRKILLLAGDTMAFLGATWLMFIVRFGWPIPNTIITSHTMALILLYVIWVIILYVFNLYDFQYARPTTQTIRNIILSLVTALVSGVLLFYIIPSSVTPKTNLLILVGFFGLLFFLWRLLYFRIFTTSFKTKIVTLGTNKETEILIQEIKKNPHLGYTFAGNFTDFKNALNTLGDTGIIVYHPHLSSDDLTLLATTKCRALSTRDAFQNILFRIPINLVDDSVAIRIMERREGALYVIFRRLIEIIIAIAILLIFTPFIVLAFIAIKIEDRGPLFYRQTRVGLRGKYFKILKLRSMKQNAEVSGVQWADKKDPRITRVGNILRLTHLDEVPQMINILSGDIALVGPRPERPEFIENLEKQIPYYFLRHSIKPGFTGWAQIMFRYARSIMESQEKFEYDLYYLNNRNIFLDFGIILKTVQIIFTH